MARQAGDTRIRGTIDGITFYRMDGRYYARAKSSLSGRRVKRDPAFRRTMASAGRLARGSQLASLIYRQVAKEKREYALFCALKRVAVLALKAGKGEEEVLQLLLEYLVPTRVEIKKRRPKPATVSGRTREGRSLFVVPVPKKYRSTESDIETKTRWRKRRDRDLESDLCNVVPVAYDFVTDA